MSRIFFSLLLGCASLFAGYLGSYTARIGPSDHRNSRGMPLSDVGEILRQDRANYYRFGLRDPEDTGIGYFRSRSRRARIPRMTRRGWIEPGLASEIVYGNPLIWVEVYSDRLQVYRADRLYRQRGISPSSEHQAPVASPTASVRTPLRDEESVRRDVLARLRAHGPASAFGLNLHHSNAPLEHKIILIQKCKENSADKLFVLAQTNVYNDPNIKYLAKKNRCHSCTPALSFFVYQRGVNGNWQAVESHYRLSGYGAWGEGPDKEEVAFIHLSPTLCGLAIRQYYLTQGWSQKSYHLFLHQPYGLNKIFQSTLSLNSSASLTPKKTDWKSIIRLLPGQGKLYEIHLHRKGIDEYRPVDYRVIYRYDGRVYKPDRPDPLNQLTD